MAAQVAVFPQINNAFGVGKLHLRVGTMKIFMGGFGGRQDLRVQV